MIKFLLIIRFRISERSIILIRSIILRLRIKLLNYLEGTFRSYNSRKPFAISASIGLLDILTLIQTYKKRINSDNFLRFPNITSKFEINIIINNIKLISN